MVRSKINFRSIFERQFLDILKTLAPLTSLNYILVLSKLRTECQKKRDDALNFRTVNININRDVPQCKPDGSYDDIQCSATTGRCWCVYYNNLPVLSTETDAKPYCPQTGK